jgi:predicted HNH restriction endonuclease
MSARIEQIIEVIEEVRDNFRNRKGYSSIRTMRIAAGHSVAARRAITNQAVVDKFIRQFRPQINSAAQFDTLLENWLLHDSAELQSIISIHKTSKNDEVLINNAFYKADEGDILLSEEFGFDPNDSEFKEGKEKLKIHLIKERNRNLVQLAKEKWNREYSGNIPCSICCFSFQEKYGEIGKGYIEAHHLIPLSTLSANVVTKVIDLAPVCSNCHSIIHRHRPWLSISDLRQALHRENDLKL